MNNIKKLIKYLDSGVPELQEKALVGLAEAESYEAVPKIVKLLKSPEPNIRFSAVRALGYLGKEKPAKIGNYIKDLLRDPEEIVRSEVIEVLGLLEYYPALESVKFLVRNDSSPLVRASAAETLGEIGDEETLETLETVLADREEDESIRAYAANSIGMLGTPDLIPKLDKYLAGEESIKVKAELLGAKYWLGSKEALEKLLNLLEGADKALATIILDIITDLTDSYDSSVLAEDAPQLSNALTAIAKRIPTLRPHVEEILEIVNDDTFS